MKFNREWPDVVICSMTYIGVFWGLGLGFQVWLFVVDLVDFSAKGKTPDGTRAQFVGAKWSQQATPIFPQNTLRAWNAVDVLVLCVLVGCAETATFAKFILRYGNLAGTCGTVANVGWECLAVTPQFNIGTWFMLFTSVWAMVLSQSVFTHMSKLMLG